MVYTFQYYILIHKRLTSLTFERESFILTIIFFLLTGEECELIIKTNKTPQHNVIRIFKYLTLRQFTK